MCSFGKAWPGSWPSYGTSLTEPRRAPESGTTRGSTDRPGSDVLNPSLDALPILRMVSQYKAPATKPQGLLVVRQVRQPPTSALMMSPNRSQVLPLEP